MCCLAALLPGFFGRRISATGFEFGVPGVPDLLLDGGLQNVGYKREYRQAL